MASFGSFSRNASHYVCSKKRILPEGKPWRRYPILLVKVGPLTIRFQRFDSMRFVSILLVKVGPLTNSIRVSFRYVFQRIHSFSIRFSDTFRYVFRTADLFGIPHRVCRGLFFRGITLPSHLVQDGFIRKPTQGEDAPFRGSKNGTLNPLVLFHFLLSAPKKIVGGSAGPGPTATLRATENVSKFFISKPQRLVVKIA